MQKKQVQVLILLAFGISMELVLALYFLKGPMDQNNLMSAQAEKITLASTLAIAYNQNGQPIQSLPGSAPETGAFASGAEGYLAPDASASLDGTPGLESAYPNPAVDANGQFIDNMDPALVHPEIQTTWDDEHQPGSMPVDEAPLNGSGDAPASADPGSSAGYPAPAQDYSNAPVYNAYPASEQNQPPAAEATQPAAEPTQPAAEATQPAVEPTQPVAETPQTAALPTATASLEPATSTPAPAQASATPTLPPAPIPSATAPAATPTPASSATPEAARTPAGSVTPPVVNSPEPDTTPPAAVTPTVITPSAAAAAGLVSVPAAAPKLDGKGDDAAWADAPAVRITTQGGANASATQVTLKSVYDAQSVSFLLTWSDPTQSFLVSPWELQSGGWKKLAGPDARGDDENTYSEDQLSLLWPISTGWNDFSQRGCAGACHSGENADAKPYGNMYTAKGQLADLWAWKSVHNLNQVDDLLLNDTAYSQKNFSAGIHGDPNSGGGYASNPVNAQKGPTYMPAGGGDRSGAPGYILDAEKVALQGELFKVGDRLPNVLKSAFKGDRGDLHAAWRYTNKTWTLEISRKLVTGSANDVQFSDLTKTYWFALATFDNASVRHAVQSGATEFTFKK